MFLLSELLATFNDRMTALLAKKYRIFALTYFAYTVIYITRKGLSVVKTLIQEDLSVTAYGLGAIDSAFLGSYAVFQILLPSLSDFYGVRPVLVWSFSGAAVCSIWFGLSGTAHGLIAAWLFEGLCHASVFAVLIKSVSLWFPSHQRTSILGLWTTSQQVGAIAATALATFVSTRWGWRNVFHVAGLITAATAVLLYYYLPEPPLNLLNATRKDGNIQYAMVELSTLDSGTKRRKSGKTSSSSFSTHHGEDDTPKSITTEPSGRGRVSSPSDTCVKSVSPCTEQSEIGDSSETIQLAAAEIIPSNNHLSAPPLRFLDMLCIPGLLSCGTAYFCVKLVRYALLFWLPFFLVTEKGFAMSVAGYSSMLFDAGGVLGAILAGLLIQRVFKGRKFIATGSMCIAASAALLGFAYAAVPNKTTLTDSQSARDFVMALVLMTLVGFLIAGPDSVLGASAAGDVCERYSITNARLSTATGIVNGLGAFGGVAQGYVTAIISEQLGWPTLFLFFCIACLTGAILLSPLIIAEIRGESKAKYLPR